MLTQEELNEIVTQYAEEDALPPLSEAEEAYRRGFAQGFHVGRTNPKVSGADVKIWQNTRKIIAPPGSPMHATKYLERF